MHILQNVVRSVRGELLIAVLGMGMLLTGCDESSPAATESGAEKPEVESSLSTSAPADEPGTSEIPGDEESTPLPNQYIVVLDEGEVTAKSASAVRSIANSLLGKSASVTHTYTSALTGFAASQVPSTSAQTLRSNSRVKYVEQDRTVHAWATQTSAPWGLDRIDARSGLDNEFTYDADGSGVNVYVLDTGIRTSHNEFGGRATIGYDAIGDGQNGQDCDGHGTHVSGTVGGSTYGVAKDADLVGVRVLDCQGDGTLSGVLDGIDWVTQNHQDPAVANMSLGGGASQALDDAVSNSISAGVPYVVAAGNSDADACNYSPARVEDAVTVGATTSSDTRSSFSNYGSCVDVFAPGSNITSAWYSSDGATNTIGGTSMASPHVAGVAALFLESNSGATPTAVFDSITTTATQGELSALSGSPNRLLYSPLERSGNNGGGDDGDDGGDGGSAPCTSCSVYTGSLSGSGDSDQEPDGTYYAGDGTEVGHLRGPSGADFDLYLYKWSGFGWTQVASATSSDANETIDYNGTSGYYYWEVYAYSGSGSYDFYLED